MGKRFFKRQLTLEDLRRAIRRSIEKELRSAPPDAPPRNIDAEVEKALPIQIRRRIELASARILYLQRFAKVDLARMSTAERQVALAAGREEVEEPKRDRETQGAKS